MLTKEKLLDVLRFDEKSGRFFWNVKRRGISVGQEAGSADAYGYGQIRIDGEIYKEHHLVWLYLTGEWPNSQIDHINHQRRDNRPENLRPADNAENHKNRPMQRNNKTGVVGVYKDKLGGYNAYISVDGKRIHLGRFKNIEDAAASRYEANKKYGYHENHGVGFGVSKRNHPLDNRRRQADQSRVQGQDCRANQE